MPDTSLKVLHSLTDSIFPMTVGVGISIIPMLECKTVCSESVASGLDFVCNRSKLIYQIHLFIQTFIRQTCIVLLLSETECRCWGHQRPRQMREGLQPAEPMAVSSPPRLLPLIGATVSRWGSKVLRVCVNLTP